MKRFWKRACVYARFFLIGCVFFGHIYMGRECVACGHVTEVDQT